MLRRHSHNLFRLALVVVCSILVSAGAAHAATLSLSPQTATVKAGNIISVKVMVLPGGKAINSAEGQLNFPTNILQVVSISKSASIFSIWIQDPQFSNQAGTVVFEGGMPSPGYSGASGEVATIVFLAKAAGTATLVFGDASVRQNDGLGTDVLSVKGSATITVSPNEQVADIPVVPSPGAPPAPSVTSVSHPDQGTWYATDTASLAWKVPKEVTSVATSMSRSAGTPTVLYSPPIATRTIGDLDDGIWYFNVRYKNSSGWGAITHYRLQVDTTAPVPFKIILPDGSATSSPLAAVFFNATDTVSGIDHYEVVVDDRAPQAFKGASTPDHPYMTSTLDPGMHTVIVKAIDRAGNETVQTAQLNITSIAAPIITDYVPELPESDNLRIKGITAPVSMVEIRIEGLATNVAQMVKSNSEGVFTFLWPDLLQPGSYKLTARAIDAFGAKSEYTSPLSFVVRTSALSQVRAFVFDWLSVIVVALALLSGLGAFISYLVIKHMRFSRSVRSGIRGTEVAIHKAFEALCESMSDQIMSLEATADKRDLTKEEAAVMKTLRQHFRVAEGYLEKEVANIGQKKK